MNISFFRIYNVMIAIALLIHGLNIQAMHRLKNVRYLAQQMRCMSKKQDHNFLNIKKPHTPTTNQKLDDLMLHPDKNSNEFKQAAKEIFNNIKNDYVAEQENADTMGLAVLSGLTLFLGVCLYSLFIPPTPEVSQSLDTRLKNCTN